MWGRRHQLGGFTLVELLVVISLITLLIALLLPALSNAKAAGRAVQCSANMRQSVMALHLYVGDHKLYYPAIARDDAFHWADWHPALIIKGYLPYSGPQLKFGSGVSPSYSGGAYCPDMMERDAPCFQREPDPVYTYIWFLSHFGLNQVPWTKGALPSGWASPFRSELIKQPSASVLIGESYNQNFVQYSVPPNNGALNFTHSAGTTSNIGFFDGHMDVIRIDHPEYLQPWGGSYLFWSGF